MDGWEQRTIIQRIFRDMKNFENSELAQFLAEWNGKGDSVLVHTSGSTGKPKPMLVEKSRMMASAQLTCDFLDLKSGDSALLCMSLKYIAGKMMVVRSILRGMKLVVVPPSGHPLETLVESPVFAAMVPMQVYNSLQNEREAKLLRGIKQLIIGGGAIDSSLEMQLKEFPNGVWSTYGMTETLSHIALRRINGDEASDYYHPMDGVKVWLSDKGTLCIDAPRVCAEVLETNDVAEICHDGSFRILGRIDNVVCSGGVKIQIEEVEKEVYRLFELNFERQPLIGERLQITSVPDEKFGQILVALIEGSEEQSRLWKICFSKVDKYWRPKKICAVDELCLTDTGKLCRAWAKEVAKTASLRDF